MILGPIELLIVLVILASYVIPVWAIVDAATRTDADFAAIGSSKTTQLLVLIISALLCGIVGTVLSLIYLLGPRRQLRARAAAEHTRTSHGS